MACVCRNCRQLVAVFRTGAGGIRWRLRIRRIVDAPTRWPSLSGSPWILWYPQRGFSRAIRTTSATRTSLIGGRPGWFGVCPPSALEAAMPAQDRVRGDQAVATQSSGQPPGETGEDRSVRPVHAWLWVGATEDCDLVAQHAEL